LSQLSTKDTNNDGNSEEEYLSTNTKRQLSTPSTPDVISKKTRLEADDDDENQKEEPIPGYLKSTNQIFDQLLTDHIMQSSITTMTMEDLRQLAILKHKMAAIPLRKKLWTTYFKSGTGQWQTQHSSKTTVDRRIWPMEVKKMISSTSNAMDINQQKDEQKICETLVHQHFKELNNTMEQYQNEFNKKKKDLIGYTDDMEKKIEAFVQQNGIRPLQMKLDYQIAILEYDYDAEILEREYLRYNPTEYQVK
jgi:hypothetical protein